MWVTVNLLGRSCLRDRLMRAGTVNLPFFLICFTPKVTNRRLWEIHSKKMALATKNRQMIGTTRRQGIPCAASHSGEVVV
jgi:hypothetical protein